MITGITGARGNRLGNGKTLYAVYLALWAQLTYKLPLYCNLHLYQTEYNFIESQDDLFEISGGIILIDDIYRAFMFKKKSGIKLISQLWSGETRKDDDFVIYSSSRFIDYVDKNLREHTNTIVQPIYSKATNTVTARAFDIDEMPINPPFPTCLARPTVEHLFTRYNTREKVAIW